MLPGIATPRMIERESADQLRFESVSQLASLGDVFGQVLFKRNELIVSSIIDIQQLDFADRRTERRDVQAVFVFQMPDFGDQRRISISTDVGQVWNPLASNDLHLSGERTRCDKKKVKTSTYSAH